MSRPPLDRTLCVAPMMAWTDRHCRYLHRLAAPRALLFTEMVTAAALLNGPRERLLRFDPSEHPVALQLGGSDPVDLAAAAKLAAAEGYDEINLNVGCPSPRVKEGRFGACLMREPALVADCIAALSNGVELPVTVKCRLGVDDEDSDALLSEFVDTVAAAGCSTFYIHARKALLNGLSPAQNRSIPPLQYSRVHLLKTHFPHLEFIINGGIQGCDSVSEHLQKMDGVMIGRAAYHDPCGLATVHAGIYGNEAPGSWDLMAGYQRYMTRELAAGTRLNDMTRHILGLFAGLPGARRYRQLLSDAARLRGNDLNLVKEATNALRPQAA